MPFTTILFYKYIDLENPDQIRAEQINLCQKYLSSEELDDWTQNKDKEFYIVDMRNNYEYSLGHFKNSILPKILPELEHLKNKTIVTACTGGIRCEKASEFLLKNNFADVYQLKDGTHTYMEKYPNRDLLGELFVFDNRVAIGFNLDSSDHKIVCANCVIAILI